MAERSLHRTLLPYALLCIALGLVPRVLSTGEARPLWLARTLPSAPWLALAGLMVLALVARRGLGAEKQPSMLDRRRLAFAAFVCTCLFILLADRSMSGDFMRVLLDIDRGVWLLKAEPLGPASFQLLSRLGDALGVPRILALQGSMALLSGLGVYLLHQLACTLGPRSRLTDLRFFALLSTATSALYFGHIETYTLPTLAMTAYLVQAQGVLAGHARPWLACALFALACALHMEMLCLGPSLLVCALVAARRTSLRRSLLELTLCGALPIVAIQVLSLALPPPYPQYYGGGDRTMLVQAWQLTRAPYWLGVLGILGTFAPGAVASTGLLWSAKQSKDRQAHLLFAGALAGTFLTFVLVWNPDLGYLRDWDLFAPAGLALTFAALSGLAEGLPGPQQELALWALLVTNLMRSLPFVLDNARL